MHVPQRNTIFISIAAGICESKNIQEIWYGANFDDFENLFTDCTQLYIGKINKLLEISGVRPIKVYAPLLGMNKIMITSLLKKYDIKESVSYRIKYKLIRRYINSLRRIYLNATNPLFLLTSAYPIQSPAHLVFFLHVLHKRNFSFSFLFL